MYKTITNNLNKYKIKQVGVTKTTSTIRIGDVGDYDKSGFQ